MKKYGSIENLNKMTYANSFLQSFANTIQQETEELKQLAETMDLSHLSYEEREDYLMRLYVGEEILNKYKGINTPDFGQQLPKYKPKTGQKLVKLKAGDKVISFADEWSSPFSFESKSMMDLTLFDDGVPEIDQNDIDNYKSRSLPSGKALSEITKNSPRSPCKPKIPAAQQNPKLLEY